MAYADSHCHLFDSRWISQCGEIITQSKVNQITLFLQGGVGPDDWDLQLDLHNKYPSILPVFGLHPYWVSSHSERVGEKALDQLAKYLPRCRAAGEMGLDFRPPYKESTELQISFFEKQLELAEVAHRPVVLHLVHAHAEALRVLHLRGVPSAGGFVHGFSGSGEQAQDFLKLGLYISVGRQVFQSRKLKRAVQIIPLDRLLIESDSPDQLSHPSEVWKVAETVGQWLGQSANEVLDISTRNLRKLLAL